MKTFCHEMIGKCKNNFVSIDSKTMAVNVHSQWFSTVTKQ